MTAEQAIPQAKLPLWRLIAGSAVLGSFVLVLLALAPVYLNNYRLSREVRAMASNPSASTTPDEALRTEVLRRANALNLPVLPGDVAVEHPGGKLRLGLKYIVQVNLGLYQVDLHFHSEAGAP